MIKRQAYLDQVIPLVDKPLIKVITGVRRCGKTVLLSQIQDYLLEHGKRKEQIVYVTLESKRNKEFKDGDVLYAYLLSVYQRVQTKCYIFIDEIQMVDKWEEVVSSLLVDLDCDIYITGSNSKLLSGELATLIAGRYIQIQLYPFTLSEAKEIMTEYGKYTTDEALFQDYLKYGGLPMRFVLENISIEPYLSDTYDGIITKDILRRYKIKNDHLLNSLLSFLMDNVGNPFSARSIVSHFATCGIKTTVDTIMDYIAYIQSSMIIYTAQRYDLKGKSLLSSNEKYYTVDLGLRNVTKNSETVDYNKSYENIVFLELLYRGYDVKIGKFDSYEIDFVAYRGNSRAYFQVCYSLDSDKTIQREFGNLERINDNYPKYVISGDIPDFSRNGIQHYNILDFLLNRK